jgi:hypothetical protein
MRQGTTPWASPSAGLHALVLAALLWLLGGLLPAPALGTPAWLSPINLSAAGQDAEAPQVAVDPAGNVITVWSRSNGSNTIVQSAIRPAGGGWEAPVDLSAAGQNAEAPQVAVDPGGNAVAVWSRFNGAITGSNSIIQGTARAAGGAWGSPVDLSAAGRNADEAQVAINPAGSAVAVWRRYNGAQYIIQGSSKLAEGPWGAPVDLSAAGQNAEVPQVAVDPADNAVAVWSRFNGTNYIVQSATRPTGGPWEAPIDLSVAGQNAKAPQVAVDPAGNVITVWSRSNGSNTIVQSAIRPAGGGWEAPVDLSAAGQNAEAPQVAVDPGGNAVAVWSRFNGGPTRTIQSATRPAGGAWESPADLSVASQNAEAPQVAVDPGGNAVAVWASTSGSPTVVQSASRPPGGIWVPKIDLSVVGHSATEPQVALDHAGNGVATWSRNNGANTIVQGTGYDRAGPQLRSLSIATAGTVRQPVSFSVSPFDVWSAIGQINWSFGDGENADGSTVTHAFARPGTYQVTVASSDALGNASSVTGAIKIFPKAWAGHNARMRRGRALLRLHCPSPAGCQGAVKLIAVAKVERNGHHFGRRVSIGRAPFSITGQQTTTVSVEISRKGQTLVRQAGKKGLKTQLTGPGIKHRIVVLFAPHR